MGSSELSEKNAKGKAVKYAKTQVELAKLLGISRRTLCTWRKLQGAPKPLSNGMWPVADWQKFVHENGLKQEIEADQGDLRTRKLLAEIEERELKVAIRKKEYVRIEDVRSGWMTLAAQATAILRAKFENELPPVLAGLDATGIQAECRKAIDEVLRNLQSL
jgi:hypothetical protein